MNETRHDSAMVAEVLAELAVRPGGLWVDATVDGGGHAEAILQASAPDGRLIGVDMDPSALEIARARLGRFGERVTLVHDRFSRVDRAVGKLTADKADALLADLGPSRHQLVSHERGFSFASDARLDARFDRTQALSAWSVVNESTRDELVKVLSLTGKPRQARVVADAILRRRQDGAIETVSELAAVVRKAIGRHRRGAADAATEWLMSIRFVVNDELEEAAEGIEAATRIVKPGGRVVILSWDGTTHGVVRRKLRSLAHPCTCPQDLPCTCGRQAVLWVREGKGRPASEAEQRRNRATRTCRLFSAQIAPPEDG